MALSNLFGWGKKEAPASACGAADKPEEKPAAAKKPAATEGPAPEPVKAAAPAAEPEKKAPPAPGTAGEFKLYNTDPRDAAMVMAIVADATGIPLNQLRFKSIKEVKE